MDEGKRQQTLWDYRVVSEHERVLVQGVADFFEARDRTEPEYGVHLTCSLSVGVGI